MTKYEKDLGVPKIRDLKKIDPLEKSTLGHKRHRKYYPPHWQIRTYGFWASVRLKSDESWHYTDGGMLGRIRLVKYSEEYNSIRKLMKDGLLDEALAILTKHHPETAEWPVRFINVPVMKTTREVLT